MEKIRVRSHLVRTALGTVVVLVILVLFGLFVRGVAEALIKLNVLSEEASDLAWQVLLGLLVAGLIIALGKRVGDGLFFNNP